MRAVLGWASESQRVSVERERGAALVEMAIVTPILFLLIFGIIEFGWAFGQHLDVRHGAREGARLAAVNYRPIGTTGSDQTDAIIAQVCDRMNLPQAATVDLSFEASGAQEKLQGSRARIEVGTAFDSLTGFIDFALAGVRLESGVDFRLERDVSWEEGSGTCS